MIYKLFIITLMIQLIFAKDFCNHNTYDLNIIKGYNCKLYCKTPTFGVCSIMISPNQIYNYQVSSSDNDETIHYLSISNHFCFRDDNFECSNSKYYKMESYLDGIKLSNGIQIKYINNNLRVVTSKYSTECIYFIRNMANIGNNNYNLNEIFNSKLDNYNNCTNVIFVTPVDCFTNLQMYNCNNNLEDCYNNLLFNNCALVHNEYSI